MGVFNINDDFSKIFEDFKNETFGCSRFETVDHPKWDPNNCRDGHVFGSMRYADGPVEYPDGYFQSWWDPETFDWKDSSWRLPTYFKKYFNIWWDPEKYNWEDHLTPLIRECCDHFEVWWDPKKFNWEKYSWGLPKSCKKYFNKWWDPERFSWKTGLSELVQHCINHIEVWWDIDKIVKYSNSEDIRKIINYSCLDTKYKIQLKLLTSK